MSRRIDRIVELAARLAEARAVAAMLEAELEAMLGKPGKAAVEAPARPEANGTSNGKVKRGERMAQVADLAKDGLDVPAIADKLGITRACAAILKRARSNGLAPKARASS
jgi:DNA-binding NarL/FixJ family response regulator